MKVAVVHCPVGIFAFANGELVDDVFFSGRPEVIAENLRSLLRGRSVEATRELASKVVSKGYTELVCEDATLASAFENESIETSVGHTGAGELLSGRLEELAIERGHVSTPQELKELIHAVFVEMARRTVQEVSGRRDLMICQAILTLDDLEKTFNLFSNRLREWYGYSFPELGSIINESELYVYLVAHIGDRRNLSLDRLEHEAITKQKAKQLVQAASGSMGAELHEDDMKEIVSFAKALLQIYESRKHLENYLESTMRDVAPNILTLVGPTLGARLIAAVGGLENLAKRSASTIQVLGAEKALFRSIRSGTRPPKHGLIFQHKEVHQAPRWQRGKIARALAGKVAIAARLDAYKGEYMGIELLRNLEERVKEIQQKYSEPMRRREKSG